MSSALPIQPYLKAATYDQEPSTFTDLNLLFRNFATKRLRPSLSSPPLTKDVGELEFVFDKTALRLYTKIDGSLRYVVFT